MVGAFTAARDVLYDRLAAVMSSRQFAELYPDAITPQVTLGFPTNEPYAFVSVDEIASDISTEGAASMGHATYTFTVAVTAFAQHVDLATASNTLMAYVDAVFAAVLADHTLCATVDNAMPRTVSEGTSADSSKRYIAAAQIAVECRIFAQCPAEIKEIVDGIEK